MGSPPDGHQVALGQAGIGAWADLGHGPGRVRLTGASLGRPHPAPPLLSPTGSWPCSHPILLCVCTRTMACPTPPRLLVNKQPGC